jgi:oxalate decarboxylase
MKGAMSEIREARINRRQAIGAAGAAGVLGLMSHVMRPAASSPPTGQPSAGQSLPMAQAGEANKFNVFGISPQVVEPHRTVTKVTGDNFPVLKGNQAAVFYLVMKPGAVREPHWHPDAWELDVPLPGNGRLGVVNPNDTWTAQAITPGSEIGFIPQGYAHYIENIGKDDVRWMIVFNNTYPDDIGLPTMFGGMPTHAFTQTFGIPEDALAGATKPKQTLFIV